MMYGLNPYSGMQNMFGANVPHEGSYWRRQAEGMRNMSESDIMRRNQLQAFGARNASNGWLALEAEARAIKPKKPPNFAARAAYADRTAKTQKERKLADLMVFVAKYREGNPGIVVFPAWLSEGGRKRLLDIVNGRREGI